MQYRRYYFVVRRKKDARGISHHSQRQVQRGAVKNRPATTKKER